MHSWKCSQITEGRLADLDGLGDGGFRAGRQAEGRGDSGAKLEKFATRHVEPLLDAGKIFPFEFEDGGSHGLALPCVVISGFIATRELLAFDPHQTP